MSDLEAGSRRYLAFDLDQLQSDRSKSYAEFLRRPGLSMGIYHLPVDGTDRQHPHVADEVYVVLAGRGSLEVAGERVRVERGTVVSVDSGTDHHFVDVTEDLSVLVTFAPPDTPAD
jgi:mannose-6-phosphate isomerase-like protein (cupin superfamily)